MLYIQIRRCPMVLHFDFDKLNSSCFELNNSEHLFRSFCKPKTVGDNNKISSAYIIKPTYLLPISQPVPAHLASLEQGFTKKLNRAGDSVLPCLTPLFILQL